MEENWRQTLPFKGISHEELPVSGIEIKGGEVLVPAMTEEEVAASTASRGHRMVPVNIPDFCTPFQFKQVLAATYSLYMRAGVLPDEQTIVNELQDIGKTRVEKIIRHPTFRRALLIRGIDYSVNRYITPEQDMAIAIVGAPDGRTFTQKLKAAGVAPSKWRAWLKSPAFREAWNNYGGSVLTEHENDMLVALVGKALEGDTNAIKYALEVSGRHDPNKRNNIDAGTLIMHFIEIVQQEVKDRSTLERIAARMKMVGQTPGVQQIMQDTREHFEQIEG